MKIGIIGTGRIAAGLGKRLTAKGYSVMFGSRELEKARALAGEMERGAVGGTIANAIHYGEMVILAVPYGAVESVLRTTDKLVDKILIDCTNALVPGNPVSPAFTGNTSAAEQIAKMAPGARVVKAFNTAFAEQLEISPYFGPMDASMLYCGDDEAARNEVKLLIEATGFEPIDCGALENARYLESMAVLIIRLGKTYGREIAWKLLRRE